MDVNDRVRRKPKPPKPIKRLRPIFQDGIIVWKVTDADTEVRIEQLQEMCGAK